MLGFICIGGLGYAETLSRQVIVTITGTGNELLTGLSFFALVALCSLVLSLPFSYYLTFHIEEKHGFNRQTPKGFWGDLAKSIVIGLVLGGIVLTVLLLIMMKAGAYWWVYGWVFMFGFSLFTVWIYPTVLAPLFNKFRPIEEGELKQGIFAMADKVGFKTDSIYIMDASKRSSHGNAYFTGVFGRKRIVLFDTLVSALGVKEIIAVLAHEIGHCKLHHVRWRLVRSFFMTGFTFFLLDLFITRESFYLTFSLDGISSYGALVVFSLWFSLIEFILHPFATLLSRRNEFAADRFACQALDNDGTDLRTGLLKLREKSSAMPITHPLFSAFYYSHPPLIERLQALADSGANR